MKIRFKSKVGFVENEESRRYIVSTPGFFTPHFRTLPEGSIKQGSGGVHPDDEELRREYDAHMVRGIQMYERFLDLGVAPEQARMTLAQGTEVNWVWTGSLYGFACFYNSRSDRSHAQGEIADLAEMVGAIMEKLFPVAWAALVSTNVTEPVAES